MAMVFTINRDSTLPLLRMELVHNGRSEYRKAYLALQAADGVTFSMWNKETGIYKIANAPAEIVYDEYSGCEERYLLQYRWKNRDVNESGDFVGEFRITFSDNIVMEGVSFPSGDLVVPIAETLYINISDHGLKK